MRCKNSNVLEPELEELMATIGRLYRCCVCELYMLLKNSNTNKKSTVKTKKTDAFKIQIGLNFDF